MKIYLEDDNGKRTEIKSINGIPSNTDMLIFFSEVAMKPSYEDEVAMSLSLKTGKKCVVVSRMKDVIGI